jgi:hypothetical protein
MGKNLGGRGSCRATVLLRAVSDCQRFWEAAGIAAAFAAAMRLSRSFALPALAFSQPPQNSVQGERFNEETVLQSFRNTRKPMPLGG